jgi:hypothetical protein
LRKVNVTTTGVARKACCGCSKGSGLAGLLWA